MPTSSSGTTAFAIAFDFATLFAALSLDGASKVFIVAAPMMIIVPPYEGAGASREDASTAGCTGIVAAVDVHTGECLPVHHASARL